jgi:hypothetical protein
VVQPVIGFMSADSPIPALRWYSVGVNPGDSTQTSTPWGRSSAHNASPSIRLKALLAP